MHPRTRRQRQVLDFIVSYIERNGHEPSYQVVARHLGVSSKAGIGKHIKALEDQGLLRRQSDNGSFRLIVGNGKRAEAPDSFVAWLDAPTNGRQREDWESEPFAVPDFLLGRNDPSSMLAFRVGDDGMSGKNVFEGDVVLLEKRSHWRGGDCMVVTVNQDDTLLRCLYRDGAGVELRPANDAFEVVKCSGDEIDVHGVFRGLLRAIA